MNPDTLIPLAGGYLIAFFFLLAPLFLARRWFPSATRMAESIAVPVIIGIVAVGIVAAILPYLLTVILALFIIAGLIGITLALYRAGDGQSRHQRPHGRRKPGRIQPVRRPAGRQQRRN